MGQNSADEMYSNVRKSFVKIKRLRLKKKQKDYCVNYYKRMQNIIDTSINLHHDISTDLESLECDSSDKDYDWESDFEESELDNDYSDSFTSVDEYKEEKNYNNENLADHQNYTEQNCKTKLKSMHDTWGRSIDKSYVKIESFPVPWKNMPAVTYDSTTLMPINNSYFIFPNPNTFTYKRRKNPPFPNENKYTKKRKKNIESVQRIKNDKDFDLKERIKEEGDHFKTDLQNSILENNKFDYKKEICDTNSNHCKTEKDTCIDDRFQKSNEISEPHLTDIKSESVNDVEISQSHLKDIKLESVKDVKVEDIRKSYIRIKRLKLPWNKEIPAFTYNSKTLMPINKSTSHFVASHKKLSKDERNHLLQSSGKGNTSSKFQKDRNICLNSDSRHQNENRKNQCNICNKRFSKMSHLLVHQESMHKSFRCDHCGSTFSSILNYEAHVDLFHVSGDGNKAVDLDTKESDIDVNIDVVKHEIIDDDFGLESSVQKDIFDKSDEKNIDIVKCKIIDSSTAESLHSETLRNKKHIKKEVSEVTEKEIMNFANNDGEVEDYLNFLKHIDSNIINE